MHIKDHSAAMKFFRTYDNAASKGKWKEFVDEMEFDSMLQEPRTMAQEPRNMYADGQLVAPSVDGSRPGYNGREGTQFKKGQTEKIAKKINKNITNWTKNWIKNNQEKYGVRKYSDFQNNLAKAWAKELKNNPNKYKGSMGVGLSVTNDLGLPNVRSALYKTGTDVAVIDGIQFPQRPIRVGSKLELPFQKVFYKNKLKNPEFKSKVNQYLEWTITNKKLNPNLLDPNVILGGGAQSKTLALEYGKKFKGFDDDVVHFMGEVLNNTALNPGGGHTGINDIFKNVMGKNADAYLKKYQGSWGRWINNFYDVAKLAGLNETQAKAVLQKQKDATQKIMKLFNVEKLPLEFMVAQDHIMGLAEAKALGDPKIAGQTLNNLVASTKEQNRVLGQEGFSNRRVKLIKDFKAAPKNARGLIIEKLNTLAEEFVPGRLKYDVRKDGSLKITNLQPEKTLKSRVKGYEELAKAFPKNIQKTLFKTYQNVGIGKNCKAYGGRVGFGEAGAVGVSQCMKNAIDDHNKNLQSEDLTVRNAARSKQFNINKTKNMKSILELGGKGVSKAVRLGKSLGAEWEPIFEGAFYEWGRRKGYTHEQAKEETFFWKMLDPTTQTGIWEGAEPLLEKELYEIKGENEFIDVDNRPPMQDPEFGQVIGERGTVKRYVDNEKALMAAQQKYNELYSAQQVATKGERGYGIDPEKAEASAKAMEATWEEMNMLEDKLDLDRDSYQAAVEKQQHTQGTRALEYGEYGQGDTEKLVKQREKRRQREMEEKFPTLTKYEINKKLEDVGLYTDPNLSYKGQTVQHPEGLKRLKGWTTEEVGDYFKDLDKSAYYADNFKMEKAEGGIMNLKKK